MKTPLDKALDEFHDTLYQSRLEDQSRINDAVEKVLIEMRNEIRTLKPKE